MAWRRPTALAVGVLHFCTACYAYSPVRTSPPVGAQVALEVNDEGRVALNQPLGPGVLRLQGTLAALDGDDFVVDASTVTPIRGQEMPVSGIRVRLSQRFVTRVEQRRFSRKRTAIFLGSALAVVAVFLANSLSGSSTPGEPRDPPGPNQ